MKLNPQKLSISAKLLFEEANKRKILVKILDQHTLLMKKNNKSWYTRGSRTSLQSSIGKSFADRKDLSKMILNEFNIPTAKFAVVQKIDEINKLLELNFPLVLKPTLGNQGVGVIVGIKNIDEAKEKFKTIYISGDNVALYEELLTGTEYRILCINYKFVAATYRKAAFITGNNKNTIKELIDQKNAHPWRGKSHEKPLTKITVDDVMIENLNEQGLKLDSIPKRNEEIKLRKTANLSTGGEPWDATHQVSEDNIQLFEKIAKVCDLNTIGIDVMCQSLQTPITEQENAGIIEINTSPGLRMHHFPLKGKAINAAGKILDMVEKNL